MLAKFEVATGQCTDETTRRFMTDLPAAFDGWIRGVQRMRG